MPTLSAERREQKFAEMRERQRTLREIREGYAPSITTYGLSEKPPSAPEPAPELKMYRVEQVAKMLGVSRNSVIRWFRDRSVVVRTRSRETILIPREVLDEWVAEHRAS